MGSEQELFLIMFVSFSNSFLWFGITPDDKRTDTVLHTCLHVLRNACVRTRGFCCLFFLFSVLLFKK